MAATAASSSRPLVLEVWDSQASQGASLEDHTWQPAAAGLPEPTRVEWLALAGLYPRSVRVRREVTPAG